MEKKHLSVQLPPWDTLVEGDREAAKECFVENIGSDETTILRSLTFGVCEDLETFSRFDQLINFLQIGHPYLQGRTGDT